MFISLPLPLFYQYKRLSGFFLIDLTYLRRLTKYQESILIKMNTLKTKVVGQTFSIRFTLRLQGVFVKSIFLLVTGDWLFLS